MCKQDPVLVSVVVPVYNAEKYIARCIESILAQTYQNLELILVDDGSPDSSGAICDTYAEKDSRISVIHQENAGVSAARNAGIDQAKGEYLFFVDSDDWIEPNHIECLLPVDKEALIYGGRKVFVNGVLTGEQSLPAIIVEQKEWLADYSAFARRGLVLFFVSPCYQMKIISSNSLRFNTSLHISEDGIFNLEYMKYCNKIRYTDQCTYCYEDGDDTSTSLSHKFQPMRLYADMQKCIKTEEITQKDDMLIRWNHWQGVIRHYRKWLSFNNGVRKKESLSYLKDSYGNAYFRECLPYIRTHGSLDEKVETYFYAQLASSPL